MAAEAAVEIDKGTLAELAAIAFQTSDQSEIPDKIWIDSYGGVAYLRAAWSTGLTVPRIDMLQDLRHLVAEAYQIEVVAVAYERDMTWPEIDARAAALQAVL